MKNSLLFLSLIVLGYSAFGQNKIALSDEKNDPLEGTEISKDLVSDVSFRKIFKRDFTALAGTNNLPITQIVVGLNKPEIQVGKLFSFRKNKYKSIPTFGFYPFLNGKLNSENEFRLRTGQTNDVNIGYGAKVLFIPFGLTTDTWHFFDDDLTETKLFRQKNDLLKRKLRLQYSPSAMNATLNNIRAENKKYEYQIDSLEKNQTPDFELKVIGIRGKIYENAAKDSLLNQYLSDTTHLKLKTFMDDSIYEAEKNAPWTKRHFFWFTFDYNDNAQSANVFRNKTIEKKQTFRNNSLGISGNYSFLKPKTIINIFAKFEVNITNKFLEDFNAITFVEDTVVVGTKYKTSKSIEAYDVSKLSNTQFDEKSNKNILTIGATYLKGKDKKYGITANYRTDLDRNIANLKLGVIIPVILDNAKAEQSNLIFELGLPDLYSKNVDNIGNNESAFKRAYVNIKIGIPINVL